MFAPKYSLSSKLQFSIDRVAKLIAELNNQHFPEAVLYALEKEAKEISSHTSTRIEGNPLPLTEVKKILKNRPEFIRDSEREVLNYNDILTELNHKITQNKLKFDLDLILYIHNKVVDELIEKSQCGALREEPVFVNNPARRITVYWPPDQQDVPHLMEELLFWVNDNFKKTNPLLTAGIFHKQFVLIHPFIDGNGRTSRLSTKMLLARLGINTFNLFSFESYYDRHVSTYFQKVGAFGNYYDIKNEVDFTPWLEYFTDGIIDELLRVQEKLKKHA